MRFPSIVSLSCSLALGLAFAACSSTAPGPGSEGDAAPPDVDASLPQDAAAPACGDGAKAGAEACDRDAVPCASLSALYTGGDARCRADCTGYDVSACAVAPARREVVQPAVREPARWGSAQCNKGGAFPMLVQRSTTSKRWVVRLEGGGACTPAAGAPCYAREASLVSPVVDGRPLVDRTTEEARPVGNVPEDFADASYAQLVYCSSDVWSGEQNDPIEIPADATGTTTMPFRFAGRANVRAALEILVQRYGLDDGDPETRVFLQGGSAGGHGVLHNIDQLRAVLPRVTSGKRAWALANAASYFEGWGAADARVDGDWSARDQTGKPTGKYWDDVLPLAIASWRGNMGSAECLAAFPGQPAKCFFAKNLQPFLVEPAPKGLGVPVAIAANLEDPHPQDDFGIVTGGQKNLTFTAGGQAASKAWGDAHAAYAATLRWAYLPREPLGMHGVPLRTKGATTPSLQSLMDTFVREADPAPFSYVDFAPEP